MANHRLFLLLSLLAVATSAASAALGGGGAKVGGYSPIENLSDPHLMEIAKFAVEQYNNQNGARLQLVRIIKAESQVVAGMNYRLVIVAKDSSGADHDYQAIVYERPWQKVRQLTSFKPL